MWIVSYRGVEWRGLTALQAARVFQEALDRNEEDLQMEFV